MRTGISITLTSSDRHRLEALTSNRNRAQKHVWRAAIVLLSADGVGTAGYVAETNASPKPFTWTADPDEIIAAVKRGHQALDSIH